MDKYDPNPITTIVEATGLPSEIWPVIPPLQPSSNGVVAYTIGSSWVDRFSTDDISPVVTPIQLHEETISALQNLPAAHVLGHGVLIRTRPSFTAMVSIAEAANVLLGKVYSDLLLVLLEFVGREVRAQAAGEQRQQSSVTRKQEKSLVEQIQDIRWTNSNMKYSRERMDLLGLELDESFDSGNEWGSVQQKGNMKGLRAQKTFSRDNYSKNYTDSTGFIARDSFKSSHESTTKDQIAEIQHQQKTFGARLDSIQEQNKQILQMLNELSQESNKVNINLSPRQTEPRDTSSSPSTPMIEDHVKRYKNTSFSVYLRGKDKKYFLCIDSNAKLEISILSDLVDWIEIALGGTGFTTSSSFLSGCTRLEDDCQFFSGENVHPFSNPEEPQGCWRKKITSGNILGPTPSVVTAASEKVTSGTSRHSQFFPHPFNQSKDGLALTTAALWSLFDNAVERMPGCKCTFKTEGGDFIQCKSKSGKWFLWHMFSDEKPCEGEHCTNNICVALTTTEKGERVHTTSPCVLGWAAQARTNPDSPIWCTLGVTAEFRKKTFTKYEVKEIQTLAQLSIPTIVSPQIGGAITFSKRHYEVANSIDHESHLATDIAANTVVLIFDEMRGLHLACDGADIIEMLCLQYLKAMGHNASDFSLFTHLTALQRLSTWCHSSFVSSTRTYITGDYLVREASKKVSKLIELTKTASQKDSTLLYWLLEDLLRGNGGKALKTPRTAHTSWHKLAFKYPPLIFAVGDVDAKLITATGYNLKWINSDSKSKSASRLMSNVKGLVVPNYAPGGIIGGQSEFKRWLFQARLFYTANLNLTENRVIFGDKETNSEYTYHVAQCNNNPASSDSIFVSCEECSEKGPQRCLHYIE